MDKRRPLHPLLKRSALRKARARIAAGSIPVGSREFSTTVTRVFPVVSEIDDSVCSIARESARLLRSSSEGSLLAMLIQMHAEGWRLFASGSEREAFLLGGKMDTGALDAALAERFGEELPKFTSMALRGILAQTPRKVGQDTNAEVLQVRLLKALGGSAKVIANPPQVVIDLAQDLAGMFPTWRELCVTDSHVGLVIDRVLASHGIANANLGKAWGASLPVAEEWLGVPTIAFDDAAPVIEETTLMGRFAGVLARYLPEAGGLDETGAIKGVQSRVSTANGNALSWLFGVGRRALRERSASELATALGATSDRGKAAVERLVATFRSLPTLEALGENVFRDNRASLQGSTDSMIALFLQRVADLRTVAKGLLDAPLMVPEGLESVEWQGPAFDGMPFTLDDVRAMFAELPDEVGLAARAISVLAGETNVAGGYGEAIAAVDRFGAWCTRLQRVATQLNARLKQLDAPEGLRLPVLLDGERWKSLVAMKEPEGPAVEVIQQLDGDLQGILDEGRTAFAALMRAYPVTLASIRNAAKREISDLLDLARAKNTAVPATADLEALASRKLLDHVARVLRRTDDTTLRATFISECRGVGLVRTGTASERSLRSHVFSGEQMIYANPLNARKSLVKLERDGLIRFDPLAMLATLRAASTSLRDQLLFDFASQAVQLMGLPERIDAELVTWGLPGKNEGAPWADLRTGADGKVARSEVLKAFNAAFPSRASGLLYRLNRQHFIERYTLSCFTGSTILWSPKAGGWNPPVQYRHGKFAALLAGDTLPRTKDGTIDVAPAAKALVKMASKSTGEAKAAALGLLRQLPHVWVACMDLKGAELFEGTFPSDGEADGWVKRRGVVFSPPPHFATALSEGFVSTSISPHSLTLERSFEREGKAVKETGRRAFVQVPIAAPLPPSEERWKPRHLVGLDLGEAALGVCLLHLENGTETTMLLKTRRVRRLAKQVEHYRRKQQPRQQFRKGYSESTEFAIEAAIGEVCSLIDNLMVRWDAVPVFETGVSQARASNRMVQRVFAGVVQRYAFVANNQAAQAVRQSHWLGAGRWSFGFGSDVLPAARKMPIETLLKAGESEVFRDAMGGPGVMVSGYRTSVICACCGVDPQALLELAVAEGQEAFTTDGFGVGVLWVGGKEHRVRIEARTSNRAAQSAARARNRRSPWESIANRTWYISKKTDAKDLAMLLKSSLRRPPAAIGGAVTASWEFHCPMESCGVITQADVNAATNIVRRYADRVTSNADHRAGWNDPDRRPAIANDVATFNHRES